MKRRFPPCILIFCFLLLNCIKGQLLLNPSKTTMKNGLIARDNDHNNDDDKLSNGQNKDGDNDRDRDKKNNQEQVTTEVNIIYTTIVYTSAPTAVSSAATSSPLPSMYNVSNTGSAHQEQQPQQKSPSSSSNLDDPNKKEDLAESLKDDQQALKRMIMILSLVGGLGAIAVVATIVIFTRMRVKNRKQREIDQEGHEGSTFELSADVDRRSSNSNTSESDNNDRRSGGGAQGSLLGSNSPSVSISSTASLANGRTLTEPSAPPALLMIDGLEPLHRNRRNIISMSSQTTAPSPSAPTAKELDAMEEDENNGATSSTSYNQHILHHGHHHHQQQINSCSRCTPMMMAPELPPPAYTPSAPPHYALPIEATVIETSPSSSSSMSPLPSRRHSLGG
ncbi:hypothetical protein BD408DRAFT_277204 [Parasitella parasitica]|nr:hypothetical protein BD408DRAFT_277204 [Parasitella parasitica]